MTDADGPFDYKDHGFDAIRRSIDGEKIARHGVLLALELAKLIGGPNVNYELRVRRELLYLKRYIEAFLNAPSGWERFHQTLQPDADGSS